MVPEGQLPPLPGGAVYNTAIALGRMGAAWGYLWPISRDAFGQMLLGPSAGTGECRHLALPAQRPADDAGLRHPDRGEARYSFGDEGSAGRMLTPRTCPKSPTA